MRGLPVLLVEDDENDIFLLQTAFLAAAISNPIQVAHNGQEAVAYLSGQGSSALRIRLRLPCLILLDLKMPRKAGMEFLQWLRQESGLPHIPVIVLSSSGHLNDVERAYEIGANAFVVKPFSSQQRTELAQLIKGFWLQFNQLPSSKPVLGRHPVP